MENIYDVRKTDNLLFIIKKDDKLNIKINVKVAVIMNIYYLDTIDKYISYINNIPTDVFVYIYSSEIEVLDRLNFLVKRKNVFYNLKENRGRDISALLVAARNVINKYDYVCFIHDKKANSDYLKRDVEYWITNLWENTLASETYIKGVLNTFNNFLDVGLLVPPEPYGEYFNHWYSDTWGENFDCVKKLASELNLNTDIDEKKPVFTLGTVFWAKTEALKKLFDRRWSYDDFPEEPLSIDGTINHAVERIIGFVAQDAGYKVGTIMTNQYASELMLRVQDDMRMIYRGLNQITRFSDIHQLRTLEDRKKIIKEFISKYSKVYIYGAGDYGATLYKLIEDSGLTCDGFVVSKGNRKTEVYLGKKVWEIQELTPNENTGIVIGVYYSHRNQIEETLNSMGFSNYIYGF